MTKILLVEDDTDFATTIRDCLSSEEQHVDLASDGAEALELLGAGQYDLVVLDWNLPSMSGIDVLKKFRAKGGSTPVLMLTSRATVDEKELGLDSGTDDYVVKPVDVKELQARVRALLRRPARLMSDVLTAGDVELDLRRHVVCKGGKKVEVHPREHALLEFLMRHPQKIFSAEELLDAVWPSEAEVSPETVKTAVKRLRKQLDTPGQSSIIRNVYGVGYTIEGS